MTRRCGPNGIASEADSRRPRRALAFQVMFRWCAYCVSFLGERAPFEDFAPTHGICAACERDGAIMSDEAVARAKPLLAFHQRLMRAATGLTGHEPARSPAALCDEGRALGIRPIDLAMGLLQPLLYEVGRLWQTGEITAATEARFTAFVEELLDYLVLDQQRRLAPAVGRPLFLLSATGNRHTVGIRMLGLRLREEGHDVRVIRDPIEPAWLLRLIEIMRPSVVGISLSESSQLAFAKQTSDALRDRKLDARLCVGGFGVRGLDPSGLPPGLEWMMPTQGFAASPP